MLNRPIQLLYPLEVQSQDPHQEEDSPETADEPEDIQDGATPGNEPTDKSDQTKDSEAPRRRQRRAAAERADAMRIASMFELEDN